METENEPLTAEGRVNVSRNGPYLVSGGIALLRQIICSDAEGYAYKWHESDRYLAPENYTLCRCGGSRNKPFCDETHIAVGFDGTETTSRKPYLEQAEVTYGPTLKLTDAEILCASARFCLRAGGTWNLTEKSDDPEARRTAIEQAGNCPSGRLVVWEKKTGKAIEPEHERSLGLVEDPQEGVSGPIWVRGGIQVISAEGAAYETRNRVTLCRCGRSSNKPFCDGSHVDM